MRVAIVADVHGNLIALEAVLADIERQRPDLIVHGGDLALIGSRPSEVVDLIAANGWRGVLGNTDEMLFDATSRSRQEARAPKLRDWLGALFDSFQPWAKARMADRSIKWAEALPRELSEGNLTLVHAVRGDLWRAPMPDASDQEFLEVYGAASSDVVVYGHIHRPFVRNLTNLTVVNAGSVGLPFDGDWRASYVLIDDGLPVLRRVEYSVDRACRDLHQVHHPAPAWLEGILRTGRFRRPANPRYPSEPA